MPARDLPLSPARRHIGDVMSLSRSVPMSVMQRPISIARAAAAREAGAIRINWTMILVKAYALACREVPAFRRLYVKLPRPHLHEAAHSVAMVAMERDWNGEKAVMFARIHDPESKPLSVMADELRQALTEPVDSFHAFRAIRIVNRLPQPLRWLIWRLAFNIGPWRARFFGNFGVSVLGHKGFDLSHPLAPMTSVLSLGPFRADGTVRLTIGFDHRVVDGGDVAEVVAALERALEGPIAAELEALRPPGPGQPERT
ncbi:MAG: hypothetical protein ACRCTI_13015 [Beijerinckiaceae bacterium]